MRILLLMFFCSPLIAQDLSSIPGVKDFAASAIKSSKMVLLVDLNGIGRKGFEVPLRTIHDSNGTPYVEFGVGGDTQNFHDFRPLLNLDFDLTSFFDKATSIRWLKDHVTKNVSLPQVWIGPNFRVPVPDDKFQFKHITDFIGLTLALNI